MSIDTDNREVSGRFSRVAQVFLLLFLAVVAMLGAGAAMAAVPGSAQAGVSGGATATATCVSGTPAWATETPLPAGKEYAGGAVVGTDFYAVSGYNGSTIDTAVDKYDTVAGVWTTVAPIPTAVSQARSAAVGTKIYVPGGFNAGAKGSMQIYDTTTDTWSQGAALPQALYGSGVVAYGGKVYIIAGTNASFTETSVVYAYDPATDTYATKASVPAAEGNLAAGVIGNTIYAVGGIATFMHYAYNPATDTWTNIAAGLTANFQSPGAFSIGGKLWLVGGSNGFGSYPPGQEVQVYDPGTNSWSFGPVLNIPRDGSSAAGAIGDKGYIAGGAAEVDGSLLDSVESIVSGNCATATPTASSTATTPAATATATITLAPATSTAVDTATSTSTVVATETTTAVATATETPGTATATPTVCTLSFEDVPQGSTFYTYIQCMACRGIINGYPCGGAGEPCDGNNNPYFRPSANVTRGQFAKIAANAAGFNEATGAQQYEDVLPGSTFFDYIWRLTDRELVNGYACGGAGEPCGSNNLPYFRPNANITRGQIAKIDSNAAGYNDTSGAQQYQDVAPGSTFYDFIWRLSDRGLVSGYPCGGVGEPCVGPDNLPYFRPSANATRGQASKIVSSTFFPECSASAR